MRYVEVIQTAKTLQESIVDQSGGIPREAPSLTRHQLAPVRKNVSNWRHFHALNTGSHLVDGWQWLVAKAIP